MRGGLADCRSAAWLALALTLGACSLGQELGAYDLDEDDFPEAAAYPTLLEATEAQEGQIPPLNAEELGAAQEELDELRQSAARAQRRAGQIP
ncbi:MAG: hypothetical protein AAGJ92_11070 [Pseudomonadota bacterium]